MIPKLILLNLCDLCIVICICNGLGPHSVSCNVAQTCLSPSGVCHCELVDDSSWIEAEYRQLKWKCTSMTDNLFHFCANRMPLIFTCLFRLSAEIQREQHYLSHMYTPFLENVWLFVCVSVLSFLVSGLWNISIPCQLPPFLPQTGCHGKYHPVENIVSIWKWFLLLLLETAQCTITKKGWIVQTAVGKRWAFQVWLYSRSPVLEHFYISDSPVSPSNRFWLGCHQTADVTTKNDIPMAHSPFPPETVAIKVV